MTDSPLEDTAFPVDVTASERVFDGLVWDIRRDTFDYNGSPVTREYMDHTGAVAVLALDDDDRVLLIRQYRHPVGLREWELPAGLLDVEGEDPLIAAQRELEEEADLRAEDWHVLSEFATSPGGNNEVIRIYLARDVSASHGTFERAEEEADIEVAWVAIDDVVDAVLDRRLQNPSLVIGVLAAHASRARDWATLAPSDSPWDRHPKLRPAP